MSLDFTWHEMVLQSVSCIVTQFGFGGSPQGVPVAGNLCHTRLNKHINFSLSYNIRLASLPSSSITLLSPPISVDKCRRSVSSRLVSSKHN